MSKAICNTSPLLFLYRIDALSWMPKLFNEIWAPTAVVEEFQQGLKKGYSVPNLLEYKWLKIIDPKSVPSEWLSKDLGKGELMYWL